MQQIQCVHRATRRDDGASIRGRRRSCDGRRNLRSVRRRLRHRCSGVSLKFCGPPRVGRGGHGTCEQVSLPLRAVRHFSPALRKLAKRRLSSAGSLTADLCSSTSREKSGLTRIIAAATARASLSRPSSAYTLANQMFAPRLGKLWTCLFKGSTASPFRPMKT